MWCQLGSREPHEHPGVCPNGTFTEGTRHTTTAPRASPHGRASKCQPVSRACKSTFVRTTLRKDRTQLSGGTSSIAVTVIAMRTETEKGKPVAQPSGPLSLYAELHAGRKTHPSSRAGSA